MKPGPQTERAPVSPAGPEPVRGVRSRTIWLAVFSVVVAGAIAVSAWALPISAPIGADRLPFWGVGLLFAACELGAVHLRSRRATDSSSLVDLAVVLGLLLATPPDLLLGQLAGTALVLAWRRRSVELVVRQARTVLGTAVALAVFAALLPAAPVLGLSLWVPALAAALAAAVTRRALFFVGVRVVAGSMTRREFSTALWRDIVMTVTVTCIGLVIFMLLALEASVWLIVLPVGTGLLTYRAYLKERHGHQRLDFLYGATDTLLMSADVREALTILMGRTRVALGAGLAEAVLLPPAVRAPRRTRGMKEAATSEEDVELDFIVALSALAETVEGAQLLGRPLPDPMLERYLRRIGADGPVIVAVLNGDPSALGLLLVANRGEVDRQFGRSEVELLEKLAGHVAASLGHEVLQEDFGRLEQLQSQLEHMAFHDPLTSLVNRARFGEQLSHALRRRDTLVAALFIDLDDFKTVNDSLGHPAGDELLVAVADRLRLSLRVYDTPARLGGDEFAVLIDDAESMDVVIEIAERVLASLSDPFKVAATEVFVRASIGVATSHEGGRRTEDLLRNADLAMYRAKDLGKGRFELFEPEMHALAMHRHELKSELQRAVEEDQLVVLFQPVVDLPTGAITGVEALVRWQHPRLGLVSPDAFIPLAEESGLIGPIGRHVFDQACERLAAWRAASIAGESFTVSINLSVREFQAPDLVRVMTETADRAGVPTSAITLEITESALMDDLDVGIARMNLIKAAGFGLALDDFGTGYSSLSHLRRLPIDVLKVAKPFVDHIAEREEDVAFLRSILDFAQTLSLDVVVEGVESAQQARILLELGARRVQGFVFSRPVEPGVLSALLTFAPLQGFSDGEGIAGSHIGGPLQAGISEATR
jgi:diguanylate cyclase (GGDEF)-like protein